MKLLKLTSVLLIAAASMAVADKPAEVITAESSKPSPIYKSSVEAVKLDSSSELDSASSVPAVNAKDKVEADKAETQTAERRQDYAAPAPSYTQSQPASQGYYYYYYPITAETNNQNSYGGNNQISRVSNNRPRPGGAAPPRPFKAQGPSSPALKDKTDAGGPFSTIGVIGVLIGAALLVAAVFAFSGSSGRSMGWSMDDLIDESTTQWILNAVDNFDYRILDELNRI